MGDFNAMTWRGRVFRDGWANRGRVWHIDDKGRLDSDEHTPYYEVIAACGVRLTSHAIVDDNGRATCKPCIKAMHKRKG